jgi:hypothetical protein
MIKKFLGNLLLTALLILFFAAASWAQEWEKQGDYYYLTKNNRDNFSATGAGPNKFASKYLKYYGVEFLVRGPGSWEDYGRLNLEGNNLFSLPIRSGVKIEAVHLLAGGNYSNSYEHDKLMRLFGDKYFYATLTLIFVYEDGVYKEQSAPIWWDWFHLGNGEWSGGGARVKSLGDNPVRKDCSLFHIIFTNPRANAPVKNILITDSWVGDRPFTDVFALTLKSTDALDAVSKSDN